MEFIDLFAGLGGFHLALKELGHKCVFASEIDETLRRLYQKNFDMSVKGDIRKVASKDIPTHDILCAGFPCQPFSKARKRNSAGHGELSDLYKQIIRIIRHHKPKYFILENVPDLIRHDGGRTWEDIKRQLEDAGYKVGPSAPISPHDFGIPQIRKRVYIVGSRISLDGLIWPVPDANKQTPNLKEFLGNEPKDAKPIPESVKECLGIWQNFLDKLPKYEKIPLPLWSMEFGATYPYEDSTPHSTSLPTLREGHGSHGRPLIDGKTKEEIFELLPSHARVEQDVFPEWKIKMIDKNRQFYRKHKSWLDDWMKEISKFPSSFQKFEWNCQERDPRDEKRDISEYIIQTRPSGVRVKRPTTAPSLVAMASTQIPIVGWEERYMTLQECKRLQSFGEDFHLPESHGKAYSALGNAVNVEIARLVAQSLLELEPSLSQEQSKVT